MIDCDSTNYILIEDDAGLFTVEAKRSLDVAPQSAALTLSICRFEIEGHVEACRRAEAFRELAGLELERIRRRLEGKEE